MNNVAIIALEKERLANEGLLKFTGNTITVFDSKTEAEIEIPEVEEINTCFGWNKKGYMIKKGATCFIKFRVWTFKKGKKKEENETEEEAEKKGKCYLKLANWFTKEQVRPMTEEELKRRNRR